MTIEKIKQIIYEVTHKEISDINEKLFSKNVSLTPYDVIYILEEIYEQENVNIYSMFKAGNCKNLTVKGIYNTILYIRNEKSANNLM